jgi:hypothetical protein
MTIHEAKILSTALTQYLENSGPDDISGDDLDLAQSMLDLADAVLDAAASE